MTKENFRVYSGLTVSNSSSSANLSPTALTIGSSVVNTTAAAVGANVILTSSSLTVGNSSVNTFANSIYIGSSNVYQNGYKVSQVLIASGNVTGNPTSFTLTLGGNYSKYIIDIWNIQDTTHSTDYLNILIRYSGGVYTAADDYMWSYFQAIYNAGSSYSYSADNSDSHILTGLEFGNTDSSFSYNNAIRIEVIRPHDNTFPTVIQGQSFCNWSGADSTMFGGMRRCNTNETTDNPAIDIQSYYGYNIAKASYRIYGCEG